MSNNRTKLRDASTEAVKGWLAKLYGIDVTDCGSVEDVLELDWRTYPVGLALAYYVPDRFPVRQNIWNLTPSSKLVRLIKYAWLEHRYIVGEYFHLLISDSTLAGADSLLLLRVQVAGDPTERCKSAVSWNRTKGKYPNVIAGGGVMNYEGESYEITVEALQLTSAKYDFTP